MEAMLLCEITTSSQALSGEQLFQGCGGYSTSREKNLRYLPSLVRHCGIDVDFWFGEILAEGLVQGVLLSLMGAAL